MISTVLIRAINKRKNNWRKQGNNKNYKQQNQKKYYSTNATQEQKSVVQPKKRISFFTKLLGVGAVAAGIYVFDLWVNDDWEMVTDRFRTKVSEEERAKRPHVVILGSGWGALNMLRKLHTDEFNVTVVSPRNYFLFTPLLPSTTSGTLEVRSIMEPIRKYCIRSDATEAKFIEMECTKIDPKNKTIHCVDNSPVKGDITEIDLKYDHLIVAVGAETATFNIPGVAENSVYMKSIEDTAKIRNRVMDCFETASIPGQPEEEIKRLLHFVVVGGGPSGVEFSAELHDFVNRDIKKAFPEFGDKVTITLVEALPHILNMFDAKVIDYVEEKFQKNKEINVWTKSAVTAVEPKKIKVKAADGTIKDVPYGCLVWVTGNAPRKLITDLVAELGPQNQPVRRALTVDEHMKVVGAEGLWALGDASLTKANYPATAQVASQEGRYLGRLFNSLSNEINQDKIEQTRKYSNEKLANSSPFKYQHFGSFAYVGDYKAVADFSKSKDSHVTSQGLYTFLIWRSVYLSKLLSFRNRVLVGFDWVKAFIFGRDVSRG